MSERKDVQTAPEREMQTQGEPEVALRPAVDIFENERELTLMADMPGVSRERLEVKVDGNTLSIEGQAVIDMPEGMEALYADISTTRFRRNFTLSNELDSEQISAQMKDGVLTLRLPKRAELQPRRIEVS
jgi:HSP20 family molecular chaperone IbpA